MTCKNTEWDPFICPYCKYDICGIRYRHGMTPVRIKGMKFVVTFDFKNPQPQKEFEELKGLLITTMGLALKQNPWVTAQKIHVSAGEKSE